MTDYATAATKRCLTGQVIAPRVEGGPERVSGARRLAESAVALGVTLTLLGGLAFVRWIYELRLGR